jgi:excisionase family DNA binding protein
MGRSSAGDRIPRLLDPSALFAMLWSVQTEQVISRTDFEKKAFYTPAEISALLQVHVSTVRDWIHTQRLFAYQLSERVYRIPLSSLMEMLGETVEATRHDLSTAESDQIWRDISAEHRSAPAQG